MLSVWMFHLQTEIEIDFCDPLSGILTDTQISAAPQTGTVPLIRESSDAFPAEVSVAFIQTHAVRNISSNLKIYCTKAVI